MAEKVAEVLNRSFPDIAFGPDSAGVAALVTAIRSMTPAEQAQLISDGWVDFRDDPRRGPLERVLGPWCEVAP